jgi:ubiquinone biosynthesis protein
MEAPEEEFSLATMFQDTLKTAAEHHIAVQSNLLFLARALAMCEGLGRTLDPTYRLLDTVETHLRDIYMRQRSPERLVQRTQENYVEMGELAFDLPKRMRRLFGQVERGEITMTARLGDSQSLLEHFHRAVNRLSISVLVASVIIGLSFLTIGLGPDQRTLGLWVNVMLFVIIGCGLLLVISFWRSRSAE